MPLYIQTPEQYKTFPILMRLNTFKYCSINVRHKWNGEKKYF